VRLRWLPSPAMKMPFHYGRFGGRSLGTDMVKLV
jgi:hypothetical protein